MIDYALKKKIAAHVMSAAMSGLLYKWEYVNKNNYCFSAVLTLSDRLYPPKITIPIASISAFTIIQIYEQTPNPFTTDCMG